MKKLIVILCTSTIIIAISISILAVCKYFEYHNFAPADKTTNINVMLTRLPNWKRLMSGPIAGVDINCLNAIDGSTATIPITAELYRQFYNYDDNEINSTVNHIGTDSAYDSLISKSSSNDSEKNINLIFVTKPSNDELKLAKSAGVTLDIEPIAKDGFVFITNKSNPVNSLTIEQVQKIYSGEITNWKSVGGENMPIEAFQRDENSGSQTAMEQLVMKGLAMQKPIATKVIEDMGGLIDAVAEYNNSSRAIGYSYYYYIKNLYKNDNIKVLKINGITADNANFINNSYPFTTNYYAVIRNDEAISSPARILRDWLLTNQGQKLIEMAGYCGK